MALTIFDWATMLVALIGLVFVVNIFIIWNHLDKSMLKAKVFLDEKFLYNSWIYLFWIGTFTVMHYAMVIVYNSVSHSSNIEFRYLSDIFEFASVFLIVVFCYHWYKMLNACTLKNR